MSDTDLAYRRLIHILDDSEASYRIIDHEPEGRTDIVSPLRGNELAAAAKCMVVMVKITRKQKVYVLAVIPGDRRVDLGAIKAMKNGTYVGFAKPEIAERLSGCVMGTVVPFTWSDELELVVDPDIYDRDEIFFNAGRLDRSLALKAVDHRRIAKATEMSISVPNTNDVAAQT